MRNQWRRVPALMLIFLLMFQGLALAAASPKLTSVRFHSGHQHDRVVFDLTAMPKYEIHEDKQERTVTLDFPGTSASGLKRESFHSSRIDEVKYSLKQDHVLVTLKLRPGMGYEVKSLKNPDRVFIDVKMGAGKVPGEENQSTGGSNSRVKPAQYKLGKTVEEVAPGLTKTLYRYNDADGMVTAYFVEADKNRYTVQPALAKGKVPGRETVSAISDRYQALAAVNASYFAADGEILGVTKINNLVAGTTYYTRSAFGLDSAGAPAFGLIAYNGMITMGGKSRSVGGVDCARGENMVVIYNSAYGDRTGTNEFGMEYVVRDGKVTEIATGNSRIPKDGFVVSVHGSAKTAFAGVRKGDAAVLTEDLGAEWNNFPQILGAGPRLLENGRVNVMAAEEEFPDDIRYGRAPRSAVGVLKNGNFLLAVVDGRQESSHGLTLTEWARLLQEMGAVNAINLDGGGSSDLVVGGAVQNSPSDGDERAVGSALLIMKK